MHKITVLLIGIIFFSSQLLGNNNVADINSLKTAYIYNFLRFTKWPANSITDNTIRICVQKSSPLYETLKNLEKKKIHNFSIEIIPLKADTKNLQQCNVLLVPKNRPDMLHTVSNDSSTLLISDTPHLTAQGATINFIVQNEHLGFEINLHSLQMHHIKLSSKLLKLATNIVHKEQ